jgi:hypothetical protein
VTQLEEDSQAHAKERQPVEKENGNQVLGEE